jgi:hypothetical protein
MPRISLAEAAKRYDDARELIDEVVDGKHEPYGREGGTGLPKPIPKEHFMVLLGPPAPPDVDPPMIEVGDVIQGGTSQYANAIEYIDPDYDERTGEALRPLCQMVLDPYVDVASDTIHADGDVAWTDITLSIKSLPATPTNFLPVPPLRDDASPAERVAHPIFQQRYGLSGYPGDW